MTFAISVGIACSLILLIVSTTPASETAIGWFVGKDAELILKVRPVLSLCAAIPLFVALQNAIQGFLVSEGRTWVVNQATWLGSISMLAVAYLGVNAGQPGAISAAMGMSIGAISEIIYLVCCWRWQGRKSTV